MNSLYASRLCLIIGLVCLIAFSTSCSSGGGGGGGQAIPVTPGVELSFQTNPVNAPPGDPIPPFTVVVLDEEGNIAGSDNETEIFIGILSNGGILQAGELEGTISRKVENGVTTFDDLRIDQLGNGYTLIAEANDKTPAISQAFSISGFGSVADVILTPSISTVEAGVPFSVQVQLTDRFGLPTIAGFSGVIEFRSSDPHDAVVLPPPYIPTVQDNLNGNILNFQGLVLVSAGSVQLTVIAPFHFFFHTITLPVVPGPLDHYQLAAPGSSEPQGIGHPFGEFSGTFTVAAADKFSQTKTFYNALDEPVKITAMKIDGTPVPESKITGLGSSGNNILDQDTDFINGVADLTNKLIFTPDEKGQYIFMASSTTGIISQSAPVTMYGGPELAQYSIYLDETQKQTPSGHKLVVSFDEELEVDPTIDISLFNLPGSTDSFGTNSSLATSPVPGPKDLTITLDSTDFSLKSRQIFDASMTGANDPSGIDLVAATPAIRTKNFAFPSKKGPIADIFPGFVLESTVLGTAGNATAVAAGDLNNDGFADLVVGYGLDGNGNLLPDRIFFSNGDRTFGTPVDFTAGSPPLGTIDVDILDFDGDGDNDILQTSTFRTRLFVNQLIENPGCIDAGCWLNFGTNFIASGEITATAIADVNLDNRPDFVQSARFTENNNPDTSEAGTKVWLNSGTQFNLNDQFFFAQTNNIVLADMNRDSYLDIVEANEASDLTSGNNLVLINSRSGGIFSSFVTFESSATKAVAVADFNHDGVLDVACGNAKGTPNRIWFGSFDNNGALQFVNSFAFGDSATKGLTAMDIDEDGFVDLIEVNENEPMRIYVNNGDSTFSQLGQDLFPTGSSSLVAIDMERDGDHDLAIASANGAFLAYGSLFGGPIGGPLVQTWGNANFNKSQDILSSPNSLASAIGDLNGDGFPDMVVGTFNNNPTGIYFNDGTGNYPANPSVSLGSEAPREIEIADLDRNGTLDLIISNINGNGCKVYLNNPTGTGITGVDYTLQSINGFASSTGIGVGDFDADSDLDLMLGYFVPDATRQQSAQLFVNDGTGKFTLRINSVDNSLGPFKGLNATIAAEYKDLNFDKKFEVVLANFSASGLIIFDIKPDTASSPNCGNLPPPCVTQNAAYTLSTNPALGMVLGDINNDNRPDIITANFNLGVEVWINTSDSTAMPPISFNSGGTLSVQGNAWDVELADVDGDNDPDLIAVTDPFKPDRIFLNAGDGTFPTFFDVPSSGLGTPGTSVVSGDVNRDGDPDYCITNQFGFRVWRNDG